MAQSAQYANPEGTLVTYVGEDGARWWVAYPFATDSEISRKAAALVAAGGSISQYQAPPASVPETISDRQFFQALAMAGTITTAEALAAVKTGDIPAALQSFVDTLPSDQQFAAEMLISGATTFSKSHPMTAILRAGMGWTSDQLDSLWLTASAL